MGLPRLQMVRSLVYWSGLGLRWQKLHSNRLKQDRQTDTKSVHNTKLYLASSGCRGSSDAAKTLCPLLSQCSYLLCQLHTQTAFSPGSNTAPGRTRHILPAPHHTPNTSYKPTGWFWLAQLEAPAHLQPIPMVAGILYFLPVRLEIQGQPRRLKVGSAPPKPCGWKVEEQSFPKGNEAAVPTEERTHAG